MNRLVVDVGSRVTKIYMLGCGVVLSEATCLAVSGGEGAQIKAYGDTARALTGKAAHDTRIINPVREGNIVHPSLLAALLDYFLEKIEITPRKAKQTEILFILPCCATAKLKSTYKKIAAACGIGRVYFTLTPFAAVLGHNVSLSRTAPVFSLDIGYGKTDVAAFSLDGLMCGYTVNLGGGNIDVHIMDMLAEDFGIKVGAATAEKIKNTVGSLLEDDNKTITVGGRSVTDGSPSQVAVSSVDLDGVIKTYVDKILDYVATVLSALPAEVSSSVAESGIYLTGGLSKMDGLAEYVSSRLGIAVNVCEEPSLAAVIGGCSVLSDPELCACLATVD